MVRCILVLCLLVSGCATPDDDLPEIEFKLEAL